MLSTIAKTLFSQTAQSPTRFFATQNTKLSYVSQDAVRRFSTDVKPWKTVTIGGKTATDTGDFIITDDSPGAVTGRTGKEPMDMINSVPPIEVNGRRVACDGGMGALGHPKIYINLDGDKPAKCGYCGLRYYQKKHDHH